MFRRFLFAWRFRHAVRKANELSELFRVKYYVMTFNGKLKVIPKRTIRDLIRQKKTPKGVTAADFERRALYVALPPVERKKIDNSKTDANVSHR